MNILVLDDSVSIHKLYHKVLEKADGVRFVKCAQNVGEFVKDIYERSYDFIICDIHMGKVSGPDILIHHKEYLHGAKILLASCADRIDEEAKRLEGEGLTVVGRVQKPLHLPQIYEALKR